MDERKQETNRSECLRMDTSGSATAAAGTRGRKVGGGIIQCDGSSLLMIHLVRTQLALDPNDDFAAFLF